MKRIVKNLLPLITLSISVGNLAAQSAISVPTNALVTKSSKAVGYQVEGGSTKVDLKGTGLVKEAKGEAKVEAKRDVTLIEASVEHLAKPGEIGTEFLTYVLWAVTPDGRTSNLGEILTDEKGKGELKVTTQLQTFSLIITSEPYHSVRQPSELVVLENEPREDTKGKIFTVEKYLLMRRNEYAKLGNPLALTVDTKTVPLQMYEARNAVGIAKSHGADKYAPEIYTKAEASLKAAENLLQQNKNRKDVVSAARQTMQFAEDSRALSVDRQEQERIAKERQIASDKAKAEAEAKAAEAAAAAKRAADEEARRQAELAAAREAQLKAQAKAEADAIRAREEAARAETERVRKAAEATRLQLLNQLNRVLDTRDTPRGLVVNMADVLFETGKYNLNPLTREKLAKLSGVLLTHPGLQLEVEGHTDNTGNPQSNQTLSEQRAQAVATYLMEQGVSDQRVRVKGFGDSQPVGDNTTAAGRQQNRRVEIIVSGEAIGKSVTR